MTTATAQSHPNIAFIKYLLAKLGRTNDKACFGGKISFKVRFEALKNENTEEQLLLLSFVTYLALRAVELAHGA